VYENIIFSLLKQFPNRSFVLFIIVVSQFFCTSLWFAGNAVIKDIIREYSLQQDALGHIVSAVQFGFITGTLLFALLALADRFQPSLIFFISAVAGALANLYIFRASGFYDIVASRFATGFCLAGVYPVGMKIASDYHDKGLGKALGYLVGALVLGTAFPHLLNGIGTAFPWRYVISFTSVLAALGGLVMLVFIPAGPYRVKAGKPDFGSVFKLFGDKKFRAVAFGYFGHMWELYTFWAFVPVIIGYYTIKNSISINTPMLAFAIIGCGAISCVVGGYISLRTGSAKTAFAALFISFLCCLLSPFLFSLSFYMFILIMFIWGLAVIADSPQFTTVVAQSVPATSRGAALTLVNSIGFAITIVSIQTINLLSSSVSPELLYFVLAPGPLLGLMAMTRGRLIFN
jgi:predicted MFS family arabinose efflux permease